MSNMSTFGLEPLEQPLEKLGGIVLKLDRLVHTNVAAGLDHIRVVKGAQLAVLHEEHRPPELPQHLQHTSTYVSVRQHTSAYVSAVLQEHRPPELPQHLQHTSAYVSIRQRLVHASAHVSAVLQEHRVPQLPQHLPASDAALLTLIVPKYKSAGKNTPARGARALPGAQGACR